MINIRATHNLGREKQSSLVSQPNENEGISFHFFFFE